MNFVKILKIFDVQSKVDKYFFRMSIQVRQQNTAFFIPIMEHI